MSSDDAAAGGLRLVPVAAAVAFVSAATVGTALILQHGFGYVPCMLCLWERWPYYLGAPLALAAIVCARFARPAVARGLLVLAALLFAGGAVLGGYHAGAEWRFWPGPASCAGADAAPTSAGGLLDQMRTTRIVPCDRAALRVLGLSLAGWSAVISAGLAALSAIGARR